MKLINKKEGKWIKESRALVEKMESYIEDYKEKVCKKRCLLAGNKEEWKRRKGEIYPNGCFCNTMIEHKNKKFQREIKNQIRKLIILSEERKAFVREKLTETLP